MREAQGRPEFGEQPDAVSDIVLLAFRERLPPNAERLGLFDLPGHTILCYRQNILSTALCGLSNARPRSRLRSRAGVSHRRIGVS